MSLTYQCRYAFFCIENHAPTSDAVVARCRSVSGPGSRQCSTTGWFINIRLWFYMSADSCFIYIYVCMYVCIYIYTRKNPMCNFEVVGSLLIINYNWLIFFPWQWFTKTAPQQGSSPDDAKSSDKACEETRQVTKEPRGKWANFQCRVAGSWWFQW